MPKDALTIYRAAEEQTVLVGGKIDKVNMPDQSTLLLLVHTRNGNFRLILSCDPSLPRAHITERRYRNPDVATGTLMYFRKRLVGATIVDIIPDRSERMITYKFSALSELAERVEYILYVELTGKCANIIFAENGIIGNCLRKISAEAPGKRAVLPGLTYSYPNATGRVDIFDAETFIARVNEFTGISVRTAVNKVVAGLAPATVDELFYRLGNGDEPTPAPDIVRKFISSAKELYVKPVSPAVTFDGDKPLDCFIEPYLSCSGTVKRYDTMNAALDAYYSALFDAAEYALNSKPLRAAVKSATNKNKKRLAEAIAKLAECEKCDDDRIRGELITANIYRIKRGDVTLVADNWYDGTVVTIKLDVTKTPAQNAAAFFKSYTKKKKAITYAQNAITAANGALDVLSGIETELALCTTKPELDEVREELIALGLMKPPAKKTKIRPVPSEPYVFDVFGAKLYVGKNNAQNDRITRAADKSDIWLHVKDAHGSHAILKTPAPTDEQLTRAAELCAYYSSARGADNVAVDHTSVKHVRLKGGGRAEYKDYKTLYVTPAITD